MAVEVFTDETFKSKVSNDNKIVVKYYADWCGSCRLFAPKFRRLSEDKRFTDISFIDVNAEKNPEARKMAGVTNLPFLAIFKDGQLIDGAATSKEEVLIEMLHRLNA